MTRLLSALPPCPACGEALSTRIDCGRCNANTPWEGPLAKDVTCPECGAEAALSFPCGGCRAAHDLLAVERNLRPECAICGSRGVPGARVCGDCGALYSQGPTVSEGRPKRRLAGELTSGAVAELVRHLRIPRTVATALCAAGYDSVERVREGTAPDLARASGLTRARATRVLVAARRAVVPPPVGLGPDPAALWECPACACPTSLWAETCLDCGLPLAQERLTAEGQEATDRLRRAGLPEFLTSHLMDSLDDGRVWYAQAVALDAEGRPREALASLEAALVREPTLRRGQLLRLRILARVGSLPEAASAAHNLLHSLESVTCRHCLATVPPGAASCGACRAPFLRDTAAAARGGRTLQAQPLLVGPMHRPLVPSPAVPIPRAPRRVVAERVGVSPEPTLRRGLGEARGLVNGRGRVNGLLDRKGFINGSRVHALRLPTQEMRYRYGAVGAAAFLVLLSVNLAFGPFEPPTGMVVDGAFGDWTAKGIAPHSAVVAGPIPSLSLRSYAVHYTLSHLFLWAETEGRLFSDPVGLDTVHAFIDGDADPATGFRYEGLGADYRVTIGGGNGNVEHSGLFRFDAADQEDWNLWRYEGAPAVGRTSTTLEVELFGWTLDRFTEDFLVRFVVEGNDGEGRSESALAIGGASSALRATFEPAAAVVFPGTRLATLTFELEGPEDATVQAVSFDVTGPATVAVQGLPSRLTTETRGVALPVMITATPGAFPGQAVSVSIATIAATVPVTLTGEEVSAYVLESSPTKRVDGLFDDWAADAVPFAGLTPENPHVDLTAVGAAGQADGLFAYAKVRGRALAGSLPYNDRREVAGGSPLPDGDDEPYVPKRGEDRLVAYVDGDPGDGTGRDLGGLEADWRLVVYGRQGKVTRTDSAVWANGTWETSTLAVEAIAAGSEVEIRYAVLASPGAEVLFDLRDWTGEGDRTSTFASRGTRGSASPRTTAITPPSWPMGWRPMGTDPTELVNSEIDIRALLWDYDAQYYYVRMETQASPLDLVDHTYWIHLDFNGDGNNDWLVQEMSGWGVVCSLKWNLLNSWWGIDFANKCDVVPAPTLDDTDVGSAIRLLRNCSGTRACIDFALDRADYAVALTSFMTVTGAASLAEDDWRYGYTERNPTDLSFNPCDQWWEFDECTDPMMVPELDLVPAAALVLLPLAYWRRRRRTA